MFAPDEQLRDLMMTAIRATAPETDGDRTRRRERPPSSNASKTMGDITKPQYVLRRQALEDELERLGPPADPQLDQAATLLAHFGRFWEIEPSPAERRKLIASLFERIWEHSGVIVAVKPPARSRRTSKRPTNSPGTATSAAS